MSVAGNYILTIKIGDDEVVIEPQKIEELTITQDIDRFLPVFRLRVKDPTAALTQIIPFDKASNTISIGIARGDTHNNLNEFKFTVERRVCIEEDTYEISGVLDIDDLFSASKIRSLTGNLKDNLEVLATDELKISEVEVGSSLDYDKTIIQPNWNNAGLLKYLRYNLLGKGEEAGYFCFIKNKNGQTIFVFKSLFELYLNSVKYKFIVGPDSRKNYYPVSSFKIYDNSELITDYGALSQRYEYFKYSTGEYLSESIPIENFSSLTDYFLVDKEDKVSGISFMGVGHSNSFTSDFKGRVKNNYYRRLGDLIHMWISTYGLEDISPGDIVQVVFGEMLHRKQLFLYQHSGLWMVKRVVHIVGKSFLSNLLLVRNGIDTDMDTSLLPAINQRKL